MSIPDRVRRVEGRHRAQNIDSEVETIHRRRENDESGVRTGESSFPEQKNSYDKWEIIREWQDKMGPERYTPTACAVCAWTVPLSESTEISPTAGVPDTCISYIFPYLVGLLMLKCCIVMTSRYDQRVLGRNRETAAPSLGV